MNLFYLHSDPRLAAEAHLDKHCVKMILETAQLLSTAHRVINPERIPHYDSVGLYKTTHKNHPSAVWVRSGVDQYRWAHDLLYYLLQEYHYRYGKIHATDRLRPHLLDAPPDIDWEAPWTDPPQCMPDDVKVPDNTVEAYKRYYAKYKKDMARWTIRPEPEWWNAYVQEFHS
jgi:hypothetical protein